MGFFDFITGKNGQQAANQISDPSSLIASGQRAQDMNDPAYQALIQKYANGGGNLADILGAAGNTQVDANSSQRQDIENQINQIKADPRRQNGDKDDWNATEQQIKGLEAKESNLGGPSQMNTGALSDYLATNASTAGKFANEQLENNNAFYKGNEQQFGQNQSFADQLRGNQQTDRDAMSGKDPTYGLNEQDYTAYGQAAGNIARQSGQAEQGLAQSLAARGLSASPNGAAGVMYSGAEGNKLEALADQQRQISQARVDTARQQINNRAQLNQQYLAGANSAMGQESQAGQSALNEQLGTQFQGRQANEGTLNNQTQLQQGQNQQQQNQTNTAFNQVNQTKTPSLGDTLGAAVSGGISSGVGSQMSDAVSGNGMQKMMGQGGSGGGGGAGLGSLMALL